MKDAVKAGLPIFIGYVPAAVAFGIMAKGIGVGFLECVLFSALVFAGASQFIALNLLLTGMGPVGIVLTTLLVNFRHFLMSASLSRQMGRFAKKDWFLAAFGITDEVFSVLSFYRGAFTRTYVFVLELFAYAAWVGGTIAGYFLGGFLPEMVSKSMSVALYALLLAIFLPELKQSGRAVALTVSSGLLNAILVHAKLLPDGWSIIVCILTVAGIGSFMMKKQERETVYG